MDLSTLWQKLVEMSQSDTVTTSVGSFTITEKHLIWVLVVAVGIIALIVVREAARFLVGSFTKKAPVNVTQHESSLPSQPPQAVQTQPLTSTETSVQNPPNELLDASVERKRTLYDYVTPDSIHAEVMKQTLNNDYPYQTLKPDPNKITTSPMDNSQIVPPVSANTAPPPVGTPAAVTTTTTTVTTNANPASPATPVSASQLPPLPSTTASEPVIPEKTIAEVEVASGGQITPPVISPPQTTQFVQPPISQPEPQTPIIPFTPAMPTVAPPIPPTPVQPPPVPAPAMPPTPVIETVTTTTLPPLPVTSPAAPAPLPPLPPTPVNSDVPQMPTSPQAMPVTPPPPPTVTPQTTFTPANPLLP